MAEQKPLTTIMTLANCITITRILMIPVFILLAVYYIVSVRAGMENDLLRWGASIIFAVTCASDALDGYFARRRNEQTRLGTLLDPVADKLLLLSGLIVLTGPWGKVFGPWVPPWYVLMVISRDGLLALGSIVIDMVAGHVEIRPRLFGKASTFFQMIIITWVLIGLSEKYFLWVVAAATVCTLVSAVQYIYDGIKQLEKAHAQHLGKH